MAQHLAVSVEDVLQKLGAVNDPFVVVAAPLGRGVSTAISDVHKCTVVIAALCDDFEWRAVLARQPKRPLILVDGADEAPDWLLRLILAAPASTRVVLKTGSEIPARLAHLPSIRLL